MSALKVFNDNDNTKTIVDTTNQKEIADALNEVHIRFEQWQAEADVAAGDSQEAVIEAYQKDIDKLCLEEGYQTVDVVSLKSDHPEKTAFREKYWQEHTHSEDEVRFFVDGAGLFTMHVDGKIYEVLCEKGDFISVPANVTHWFDMGPNPHFVCIRLFNNQEGWVANYTGSDIANNFSRLDN